ncbi:MAG: hypothetical protein AB7V62_00400 [Thermoleophilia bacterium]
MSTQGPGTEQAVVPEAVPDVVPGVESPGAAGAGPLGAGLSAAALAGDPRAGLTPGRVMALSARAGNARVARLLATGAAGPVVARAPTMSEKMEEAASGETARLAAQPPPRIGEMSTVNDPEQARVQMRRVNEAIPNLFQAKAVYEHERGDTSSHAQRGEWDKKVVMVDGFVTKNEGIKTSLQEIINLSQGAATPVTTAGNAPDVDATVGAEMRHSMFTSMFGTLNRDFARLQGVVGAFLAANPKVKEGAGNEAGKDLGRAVATAGKDNQSMKQVHEGIEGQAAADSKLGRLLEEFREKMDAYTSAKHAEGVESAIKACAIEANNVRNIAMDLSVPTTRDDSPEEKAAKAAITEVNADLAAARGALDKIEAVAKLAAAAAGMPLPSIDLPTGPTMQPKVTVNSGVGPSVKVDQGGYDTAKQGAEIAGAVTDADIGKGIKDNLAKIMTDYQNRMNTAKGKLDAAAHLKGKIVGTISTEKIEGAKDRLQKAFDDLHAYIQKIEDQKKAIRDVVTRLSEERKASGGKGPDVAAIANALGEVTIFIEQGKMTREQGRKEKVLTDEMVKKREGLAGKYEQEGPSREGTDMTGNQRIASAQKDKYDKDSPVYYDATKRGDDVFEFAMNTVRFELWNDKVRKTPDAVTKELDTVLKQIDEYMETAEGFQVPLRAAMFGQ